ncbi:MAG: hypothetical protein IPM18_11435 [Phycisphaerales bacterium]|nr:hypothetical protein [Phycisphaerales bacterium]
MKRNTLLSLLVCVNLFLVTALVIFGAPPRTAHAQGAATGLAGNYMVVTGQVQANFDVLYMIDTRERTLHVFYFERGRANLQYAGYRSLERDFRHNLP